MFLGGLGLCLMVMLDHRTILATAKAVWVFLRGLGHWWEVLLECGVILSSV